MDKHEHRFLIKGIRFGSSFKSFCRAVFKIRPKKGAIVAFELNGSQEYLHECIERQKKDVGWVRAVVIKGRQQGISTYIAARFLKITTEVFGYETYILSHLASTTRKLFEIVKRYYKSMPPVIRPRIGRDSAALGFGFPDLESSYELGTANSPESGRGFTAQLFHGSEVAFWPYAAKIMAGVMQAIPEENGTEIILESTANGQGGAFYNYVKDAQIGKGDFILVFIPWYWDKGYSRKAPADFVRDQSEIEIALTVADHPDGDAYNFVLTDDQLYWRRMKIDNMKSEDLFKQEYPFTVDEAFLSSGRSVFAGKYIVAGKKYCTAPKRVVEPLLGARKFIEKPLHTLKPYNDRDKVSKGFSFDSTSGFVQVWEDPSDDMRYAIGADVAEGLEHGDYSTFDVFNHLGLQVAHYHGHIEAGLFGRLLDMIGRVYNNAYLGVESNNHGHAVLQKLKELKYPCLHYTEKLDERQKVKTKKIGWQTDQYSKQYIIDALHDEFWSDSTGIQCVHTLDQCGTYVYDEKGRANAQEGCFDDAVISCAISKEMLRVMPKHRPQSVANLPKKHWML